MNHYKLYKAGKLWCTLLIATAALAGARLTANADSQSQTQQSQVTQTTTNSNQAHNQNAVIQSANTASSNSQNSSNNQADDSAASHAIINGQAQSQLQSQTPTVDAADTNLQVQNGNLYYVVNGQRQRNAFYTSRKNGAVYYFGNNGSAYRNQLYQNWGRTYYFDGNGQRATNKWYYNWNHYYYFGSDGALYTNRFLTSQFVPDNKGGLTSSADGQTHLYYFLPRTGILAQNYFLSRWGHVYYFGNNGARYTNQ